MPSSISFFAETTDSGSGIGAFNINLKSFFFQLITFVIVLLVLRRWVFPKLISTMEERRKVLEQSLKHAKKTEQALSAAEAKASEILKQAREESDRIIREANNKSKELIASAEEAARQQAGRIISEARERIDHEHVKLRDRLKVELADLVILAGEKVLRIKLNSQEDHRLAESTIKELK